MNVVLGPDVYVNASVALGSTPELVVRRVLGWKKGQSAISEWVLSRIEAMLHAIPEFKKEVIGQQLDLIKEHVRIIDTEQDFKRDDWEKALVALAKAAGVTRVVTDHPDLLAKESSDGIEFLSTESWLVEHSIPPPTPPPRKD